METFNLIPKKNLEHGYYIGQHRNTNVAYWDHREQVFVYIKWEMWGPVTDTAKHPEDDDKFALFYPYKRIEIPDQRMPGDENFDRDKLKHNPT